MLLLCALFAFSTAHAAESASGYYDDAKRRYDAGDIAGARIQLRNALRLDRNFSAARLLFAETLIATGDGLAAEAQLRRLIEARPKSIDRDRLLILLGRALLLQRKFRNVLATVPIDNRDPGRRLQSLLLLAEATQGLGDWEGAANLYRRALAIAPRSGKAMLGLARTMLARGDFVGARAGADRILKAAPDDLDAWELRAEVAVRQGRLDDALQAYERAAAISPHNASIMSSHAQILMRKGRFDAAQESLRRVLARNRHHVPARYLLSIAELYLDNVQAAADDFATVADALRLYDPALLFKAVIEQLTGQPNRATKTLSRYVFAQPRNIVAQRVLATWLLRAGDLIAAADVLRTLLAEHPDDAAAAWLQVSAQLRDGKLSQAAATLRRIVDRGPGAGAVLAQQYLSFGGLQDAHPAERSRKGRSVRRQALVIVDYIRTGELKAAGDLIRQLKIRYGDVPPMRSLEGAWRQAGGRHVHARGIAQSDLAANLSSARTPDDRAPAERYVIRDGDYSISLAAGNAGHDGRYRSSDHARIINEDAQRYILRLVGVEAYWSLF